MPKNSAQLRSEPINFDHDSSSVEGSESYDHPSTVNGSSFHDEQPSEEEKAAAKEVASKESRQLAASKVLVGLVLVASATCAGYFTYQFMRNEETIEFERKFTAYAQEVFSISERKAVDTFVHTASFSDEITSLARYSGSEWPFFTAEDFQVRATDYHNITGILSTTLCPVVPEEDRAAWANYAQMNKDWIQRGNSYTGLNASELFFPVIFAFQDTATGDVTPVPVTDPGPVTTVWQSFPPSVELVNFHLESTPLFDVPKKYAISERRSILTELSVADTNFLFDEPTSIVFQPVFRDFKEDSEIVAYLSLYLPWTTFFENILSAGSSPVIAVVTNPCRPGSSFTLEINGPSVSFLGYEDLHDPSMEEWGMTITFAGESNIYPDENQCPYVLDLYPTTTMKSNEETSLPLITTIGAVLVFAFTSFVFILYDLLAQRQNKKVVTSVQKSAALVTELFPAEYRERLFGNENEGGDFMKKVTAKTPLVGGKRKSAMGPNFEGLLEDGTTEEGPEMYATAPVADLFPDCTILEADIAGFTAWSSTREPAMVFELLETLYAAFDDVAERRRVFKVETIGDSYVAVAGLPTPRRDHAVVMMRFAHDCLVKMNKLVQDLEVKLGPGTSSLAMRFGLHSGSVTAGVLRGDGLRFQLFGDTLDMAEEMEKNGERNKIHISEETAALLRKGGKSHWLQARPSKVNVRSKGALQTYFVFPKSSDCSSTGSSSDAGSDGHPAMSNVPSNHDLLGAADDNDVLDSKNQRLVDWNVQILARLLKLIVASRQAHAGGEDLSDSVSEDAIVSKKGTTVLDEVKEIVTLPKYTEASTEVNADDVELSPAVLQQLNTFVYDIASWYNANPFHNFEHASHVTMSATKLLSRIVAPKAMLEESCNLDSKLHDNTYGITSDPLTQFGVVLSALIHDLDHSGVPNATLVKEQDALAAKYKNKSVAEQNSVDLAWSLLMENNKYKDLRKCIYTTQTELERFRSIVINAVLATDIADKDLGAARKQRWNKAFKLGDAANHVDENPRDEVNRKATIVIEHLIQASDIAHTMQHWHVYRRWNERLFQEMYEAYSEGRLDTDPSVAWYEGEIGFFDFYIIPLAKKLKDCGVFGVSSDEYLNYATQNRNEWKERGQEVVAEYVRKYVLSGDELSL